MNKELENNTGCLLVQIGDYGTPKDYKSTPLPNGLNKKAEDRDKNNGLKYPKNPELPYPHYYIPFTTNEIIMNKIDELEINKLAYWRQNLNRIVNIYGCVNSNRKEIFNFYKEFGEVKLVFIKNKNQIKQRNSNSTPKGSKISAKFFKHYNGIEDIYENPSQNIDVDVVFTESGSTLVISELKWKRGKINLSTEVSVYFSKEDENYNSNLPIRISGYGTCSLVLFKTPDINNKFNIKPMNEGMRDILAIGKLHHHLCGIAD